MKTKKYTKKEIAEWREEVRGMVPHFYKRVREFCAPDNFQPNVFRFTVDEICGQEFSFSGYVEEYICHQLSAVDGEDGVALYGHLDPAASDLPTSSDVAVYWLFAGSKNRHQYMRYCVARLLLSIGRGESVSWLDNFDPPCPY
jgi:hypothetical protein